MQAIVFQSGLTLTWNNRNPSLLQKIPPQLLFCMVSQVCTTLIQKWLSIGGSQESYVRHIVLTAQQNNWNSVVLNFRGAGGSDISVLFLHQLRTDTPQTPQLYSAGYTGDVRYVAQYIQKKIGKSSLFAIGNYCQERLLSDCRIQFGCQRACKISWRRRSKNSFCCSCFSLQRLRYGWNVKTLRRKQSGENVHKSSCQQLDIFCQKVFYLQNLCSLHFRHYDTLSSKIDMEELLQVFHSSYYQLTRQEVKNCATVRWISHKATLRI